MVSSSQVIERRGFRAFYLGRNERDAEHLERRDLAGRRSNRRAPTPCSCGSWLSKRMSWSGRRWHYLCCGRSVD